MSAQSLNDLRDSILTSRRAPKIDLDVEWFPCPHCGTEICAEMDASVFNSEHLLFFCDEDCESEYVKGRVA